MRKINLLFIILIFILSITIFQINARYYNPTIGRFITADIVTPGEGANLQGMNRYSYCVNNPLIYTDPSGNSPEYTASKSIEFSWKEAAVVNPMSDFQTNLADNIRCFDPDQNQPPNDWVTALKSTFYSYGRTQTYVSLLYNGKYSSGNKASIKRAILYGIGQMEFLDPYGVGQFSMFAADMYSIPSSFAGVSNAYKSARKLSVNLNFLSPKAAVLLGSFTTAELGLNIAGTINSSIKLHDDLEAGADWPLIGRDILGIGEYGVNALAGVSMFYGMVNKEYFLKFGKYKVKDLVRVGAWMRVGSVGLKFLGPVGYAAQAYDAAKSINDKYDLNEVPGAAADVYKDSMMRGIWGRFIPGGGKLW